MAHPTIIDIGTDEDAGEWLAAFPYCHFPIEEHRPKPRRCAEWWDRLQLDPEDVWLTEAYKIKLTKEPSGYQRLRAEDRATKKITALARLIMRAPAAVVVDHINGDIFDNRRANLRLCSRKENSRNRRAHGGASGFVGVSRHGDRWVASITCDGATRHLGIFNDEVAAAEARDAAARELHGSFAALNFPRDGEQTAHRPCAPKIPTLGSGIEGHPADPVTSGGRTTGFIVPLRMDGSAETFNDTPGSLPDGDTLPGALCDPFHTSLTTDEGERNHGVR